MDLIDVRRNDGIAIVTLSRGKVNALNGAVVDQLREVLEAAEHDPDVRAIVLTGAGTFFSFGFDVPEVFSFSPERFTEFVTAFTELYTYLFLYPKPVVAALNGHAIAGGCMLALACDYRVMSSGKAKMSLNEIGFASSVFAGSVEMLRFCVGNTNAAAVLLSGTMYPAVEAKRLGLVDEVATQEDLMAAASKVAADLGSKSPPAFAGMKSLLRGGVAREMRSREGASVEEFVGIWYSDVTREKLRNIQIH